MRPYRATLRSSADFENLGKAFEGLAGALHEGHPIEKPDLHEACRVAHELWPVRGGGRDRIEQEYEEARMQARTWIPLATAGDLKAWADLEKACRSIGAALRWKARALPPPPPRGSAAARPWPHANEARAAIRRLDARYARYAMRPIAMAF